MPYVQQPFNDLTSYLYFNNKRLVLTLCEMGFNEDICEKTIKYSKDLRIEALIE